MQAIAYAKQAQLAKRILFAVIGPQRNTRNDDSHNLLPPRFEGKDTTEIRVEKPLFQAAKDRRDEKAKNTR